MFTIDNYLIWSFILIFFVLAQVAALPILKEINTFIFLYFLLCIALLKLNKNESWFEKIKNFMTK